MTAPADARELHYRGEAALQLAGRGFAVFPLHTPKPDGTCDCRRVDCEHIGKHPRLKGWEERASTDTDQVEKWWRIWRNANIGVACGPSGLVVLDVDPRKGGNESFLDLKEQHSEGWTNTVTVLTGGDGQHLYFRAPAGLAIRNDNTGRLGPGLDVKTAGGYVVAPPSRHGSLREYAWEASPWECELAELPAWLIEKLAEQPRAPGSPGVDYNEVLQGVPEGQRDEELFKFACSLRSKNIPRKYAEQMILEAAANCSPPFPTREALAKVESAWKYQPKQEPRRVVIRFPEDRTFDRTDTGNAEMFAALHGDKVRYDHRRGRWLSWIEHHWGFDADGEVTRHALDLAPIRFDEAVNLPDGDKGSEARQEKDRAFRFAAATASRRGIEAFLALARDLHPITDAGDRWDLDPWVLGVSNGVVDLRTGQRRDGRQEYRIALSTGVAFDPAAPCPRWERFLAEVFEGDVELIEFIQRAAGYSLTGLTGEQCLFLAHGPGGNGKSVLLSILRALMGAYATNLPFTALELGERNSGTFDLAGIAGKRLVVSSETNEGVKLNTGRVKALIGGDPITAAFKYKDAFEFTPAAKFWLAVNHLPAISDDSTAMWRRMRVIPFRREFSGPDRDDHLADKLKAELPGILAWAVQGCLAWQRDGLHTPDDVMLSTWRYREESDPLQAFITDCCELRPSATIPAGDLFKAYNHWATANGLFDRDRLTMQAFGRRMRDRFDGPKGTGGVRLYYGITLKSGEGEPGSDSGGVADNGRFPKTSSLRARARETLSEGTAIRHFESEGVADIRHSDRGTTCPIDGCGRPTVNDGLCFRHSEAAS